MLEFTVMSLKKIVRKVSEKFAETSVIASVLILFWKVPLVGIQDESFAGNYLRNYFLMYI